MAEQFGPPPETPPKYFSSIQAHNAECVRCHGAYEPQYFTDHEWQQFLPQHCKDVKIDEATTRMILRYVMKYN
jgi:diheme cytochrome c